MDNLRKQMSPQEPHYVPITEEEEKLLRGKSPAERRRWMDQNRVNHREFALELLAADKTIAELERRLEQEKARADALEEHGRGMWGLNKWLSADRSQRCSHNLPGMRVWDAAREEIECLDRRIAELERRLEALCHAGSEIKVYAITRLEKAQAAAFKEALEVARGEVEDGHGTN